MTQPWKGGLVGDLFIIIVTVIFVFPVFYYGYPFNELTPKKMVFPASLFLVRFFFPVEWSLSLGLKIPENNNIIEFLAITFTLITYFLIGAVIGLIIEKIKSKK